MTKNFDFFFVFKWTKQGLRVSEWVEFAWEWASEWSSPWPSTTNKRPGLCGQSLLHSQHCIHETMGQWGDAGRGRRGFARWYWRWCFVHDATVKRIDRTRSDPTMKWNSNLGTTKSWARRFAARNYISLFIYLFIYCLFIYLFMSMPQLVSCPVDLLVLFSYTESLRRWMEGFFFIPAEWVSDDEISHTKTNEWRWNTRLRHLLSSSHDAVHLHIII